MNNVEKLSEKWRAWAARFDGFSLRERVLSLAMAMIVFWGGLDAVLLEPALQRKAAAQQKLSAAQARSAALQAQLAALNAQLPADPNAVLRERAAQLRARLAEDETVLRDFGQGLVSPADMPGVLEKLLAETAGPRLEAFRKLPVANVLTLNAPPKPVPGSSPGQALSAVEGDNAAKPPVGEAAQLVPGGQVYRHGVELTLSGSYADLLAYLDAVEHMPWKVLWGEVRLETEQHPRLRMRLTLYTLSLERDWLTL